MSGGGRTHIALQCILGGEQPFGNQRLTVRESLTWYWNGNSDCVSERVVESNADSADAERVFFTIVCNAIAARCLQVCQQSVKTGQCLGRARLVTTADQCLDGGIGKLRQIGFAVRSAIKRKGIANRRHGAQALRANDLVDEHEMIFLNSRKVDRLVQLFRKLLQERPRQRYEIAADGRRETKYCGTQPHAAVWRRRDDEFLGFERRDDALHGR